MNRNVPLRANPDKPLRSKTGLSRTTGLSGNTASRDLGFSPEGRTRLRPVSEKRRREMRERAAMADRLWPDRRDGTVLCAVWEAMHPDWCDRYASDLHEPVSRARGGSIVDPENCLPLCRTCHTKITDEEPVWAYERRWLVHSWDAA